jgi:hypothetical protein
VLRLVPFGHVFGPLLSSFSHQVHALLKVTLQETTKTSYKHNSSLVQILQGEGTVRPTMSQPLGQPRTPQPHYSPDPPHEMRHTAETESCKEMEE